MAGFCPPAAAPALSPTRSPNCLVNWVQLVINFGSLSAAGSLNSTNFIVGLPSASGSPLATRLILSGTTPMKAGVLVLTPAIALMVDGTSSTYTPGDLYSGIAHSFIRTYDWFANSGHLPTGLHLHGCGLTQS